MELEMKIVKKVAAAAMAMAVVFGAASLSLLPQMLHRPGLRQLP